MIKDNFFIRKNEIIDDYYFDIFLDGQSPYNLGSAFYFNMYESRIIGKYEYGEALDLSDLEYYLTLFIENIRHLDKEEFLRCYELYNEDYEKIINIYNTIYDKENTIEIYENIFIKKNLTKNLKKNEINWFNEEINFLNSQFKDNGKNFGEKVLPNKDGEFKDLFELQYKVKLTFYDNLFKNKDILRNNLEETNPLDFDWLDAGERTFNDFSHIIKKNDFSSIIVCCNISSEILQSFRYFDYDEENYNREKREIEIKRKQKECFNNNIIKMIEKFYNLNLYKELLKLKNKNYVKYNNKTYSYRKLKYIVAGCSLLDYFK